MIAEFTIKLTNGEEIICKLSNRAIYSLDKEFGYSFFTRLMQDSLVGNMASALDSVKIIAMIYHTQVERKYTREQLIDLVDFSRFDEVYESIGKVMDETNSFIGQDGNDTGVESKKK